MKHLSLVLLSILSLHTLVEGASGGKQQKRRGGQFYINVATRDAASLSSSTDTETMSESHATRPIVHAPIAFAREDEGLQFVVPGIQTSHKSHANIPVESHPAYARQEEYLHSLGKTKLSKDAALGILTAELDKHFLYYASDISLNTLVDTLKKEAQAHLQTQIIDPNASFTECDIIKMVKEYTLRPLENYNLETVLPKTICHSLAQDGSTTPQQLLDTIKIIRTQATFKPNTSILRTPEELKEHSVFLRSALKKDISIRSLPEETDGANYLVGPNGTPFKFSQENNIPAHFEARKQLFSQNPTDPNALHNRKATLITLDTVKQLESQLREKETLFDSLPETVRKDADTLKEELRLLRQRIQYDTFMNLHLARQRDVQAKLDEFYSKGSNQDPLTVGTTRIVKSAVGKAVEKATSWLPWAATEAASSETAKQSPNSLFINTVIVHYQNEHDAIRQATLEGYISAKPLALAAAAVSTTTPAFGSLPALACAAGAAGSSTSTGASSES